MIKVAKITLAVSEAQQRRIKRAASQMEISIENLLYMAFENFMRRKPNKVTEKALKLSKQKKGLKRFNSIGELLEELEI